MGDLEGDRNAGEDITEEYLMTVGDEAELSVVEGILRAENIIFIIRHREAGGAVSVYTGFSNLGIDIYVSSEDLQRAKDAIGIKSGGEE